MLAVRFWKAKRIVLYDTLIAQNSEKQVLSILSHEVGHWRLNHTIKGLILSQVQMLAMFWCFGKLIHRPELYADFGFGRIGARPTYIGLLFFQFSSYTAAALRTAGGRRRRRNALAPPLLPFLLTHAPFLLPCSLSLSLSSLSASGVSILQSSTCCLS